MARSRARELELRALIEVHRPDVVALSEVELDVEDSSFHIPGYTVFYPSPHMNRFRVLLLLMDQLVRQSNPLVLAVSHQEVWVRLSGPSGSWTVAACYRQWTSSEAADLTALCDNISKYSSSSARVLLVGDFNLDAARQTDPHYYRRAMLNTFLSRLEEHGYVLENDVNIPTYRSHGSYQSAAGTGHRESVLDLVFSLGALDLRPRVRVLDNAASDHRPVLVAYNIEGERPALKTLRCRDFKRATPAALLMAINASKISDVFDEEDVDKITGILTREIGAALDLISPLRTVLIKDKRAPLYLSRETRRTMDARDAAANRRDWARYRSLRNLASRQVRRDRLATNAGLLQTCSRDPKRLWQLADSLTGRGKAGGLPPRLEQEGQVVEGDDELADVMNRHYIDKITGIRERIMLGRRQRGQGQARERFRPASSSAFSSSTSSTFVLRPPTVTEVLRAISSLRNTPALGEDGIPTSVVKNLAQVLAAPLQHLASRSFASGRVPALYKHANVVPVFKRGKDPTQPASYRPVAILCAMSKVLESLVLVQLAPFLSRRLPPEQWGFRRARSTAGALAAAHGAWTRSRIRGDTVAVAAFDFSSAFDTLGVEELVVKLRDLDIGQEAIIWFRDYLSRRVQRVRYGSASSTLRSVSFGVPQGSLLGPVLFTVLTSDLPATLSSAAHVNVTLYADDTCIWCAGKDSNTVKEQLELASSVLLDYALENSLALNPSKTQLVWSNSPSPIRVGTTVVQPQEELLLLGIRFDRRLSITPHLRALVGSARSLLALTRRLLLHLPRGPQVQEIVRSLVTGRLGYGSLLFPPRLSLGDPSSQLMQDLQVPVNDMARLLCGASRADRIPVEQLLAAAGLPAMNRMVIRAILCETWKCLNSCDGPDGGLNPLGQLLVSSSSATVPPAAAAAAASVRTTRSTSAGALVPPLRIRAETFAWWASRLHNEVPLLRSARSLAAARKAAETYSSAAPLS